MSAVDGKKRIAPPPMSDERREQLARKAVEAADRRRGFVIPPELRDKAKKEQFRWYNAGKGPMPPAALKAALGLCLVLAIAGPALGHKAPSGQWNYPINCCGKHDCEPLPANALEPTPDGWRVILTGEVIPYGMVRASGDNQNHRCRAKITDPSSATRQAYDPEGHFYCLFIAPPGG